MTKNETSSAEERIVKDFKNKFTHWVELAGKILLQGDAILASEWLKEALKSYRQEVEREAVKRFIEECEKSKDMEIPYLKNVFDRLYPSQK